ncbi:MAG: DUF885 domain-containing protein [Clostridiales bacterium]|nr:DUF885 domain-containing protein [Clostridiales bacterium]
MRKRVTVKWLTLLLAAVLLLSAVGCFGGGENPNVSEQDTLPVVTLEPTPEPTATPEPTPSPDEVFAELDQDFFRFCMEEDPSALLHFVKDPVAMGFDLTSLTITWGDFSKEGDARWIAKSKEAQAALKGIDKGSLSKSSQFAYDTFVQFLNYEVESEAFYGYYEPLGIFNGVHINLPINFYLFGIQNEADVENYFKLLEDVPRFFEQILAYEQVRSEMGIFMTKDALYNVELDMKKIMNAKPAANTMLIDFDAKVDALGLSEERAAELKERNKELVSDSFNQAYKDLLAGLKALNKTHRKSVPLCDLKLEDGVDYMKYYEQQIKILSGKDLDIAEAMKLLDKAREIIYAEYEAASYSGAASDRSDTYTVGEGTAQENMDYLKELTEGFLPKLPEHTVTILEVPKDMQKLVPFIAAYLTPKIDDWSDNTVIFNNPEKDDALLLTTAHEAYPGHLYQYNYQYALPHVSLTQKIFATETYVESWSQFAEYQVAKRTDLYPKTDLLTAQLAMAWYAVREAQASIDINYKGATAKDIQKWYGFSSMFHLVRRNEPFYRMEYSFGIANMFILYDKIKTEQGDNFNEEAFLKAFLDLGPSYFNLIEKELVPKK